MATKTTPRPGPVSLFRGKNRKPVTLTLTPAHHLKVRNNMKRLGLTRSDLLGLLVEKHADTVTTAPAGTYQRLRNAIAALGGALEPQKFNGPRGASWVLRLGDKILEVYSEQSQRYPVLDNCYRPKAGDNTSRNDDDAVIDPTGLAELFKQLDAMGKPCPRGSADN